MMLINSSCMIVAGPTQAGKTTFVMKLLENRHVLLKHPVSRVYWVSLNLPEHRREDYIQYIHEDIPTSYDFLPHNAIIVLDDLMIETLESPAVTNLFTKISHAKNVLVIYITQNYFTSGKESVTRRKNAHYVVLFKNPADVSQVRIVGSRMFPNNPQFTIGVYYDATRKPHSYLFLDLRQETVEEMRVRARILPRELPMIVYKPTNSTTNPRNSKRKWRES